MPSPCNAMVWQIHIGSSGAGAQSVECKPEAAAEDGSEQKEELKGTQLVELFSEMETESLQCSSVRGLVD